MVGEMVEENAVVEEKPKKRGRTKKEENARVDEPIKQYKSLADTNRMRLYLEANGKLDGAEFDGVRIENYDIRTKAFTGVRMVDSIFENINMQGSNFQHIDECKGNTFINCVFEYGTGIDALKADNEFINCKF